MRMRKRPQRGERYRTMDGEEVIVLEVLQDRMVKVLLPTEKTTAISKGMLNLPIIETKDYEKIQEIK